MKIKRQEINAIYSVGIVIINLGPLEAKLYFFLFSFVWEVGFPCVKWTIKEFGILLPQFQEAGITEE